MPNEFEWRVRFRQLLPLLGHRNWILIADAAYPAQVGAVELLATNEDLVSVVTEVLAAIRELGHVRPVVWLDAEINALNEDLAPGVNAVRSGLGAALDGLKTLPVLHAELLKRVGEVAESYQVLVLKTTSTVPYSSVFLELDCGYWNPEQEAALRKRMK